DPGPVDNVDEAELPPGPGGARGERGRRQERVVDQPLPCERGEEARSRLAEDPPVAARAQRLDRGTNVDGVLAGDDLELGGRLDAPVEPLVPERGGHDQRAVANGG